MTRQVRRGLAGRVAPADHDDVLVAEALGVGRHGRVVEAGPAVAVGVGDRELAPAGARRDQHGPPQDVLAVVEVDAREPLGAVGELDCPVEARQHRVEAARLERRGAGQLRTRDPGGEPEVVLDAAAHARLPARPPRLGDEGAQALRAAGDGRGQPGRPAAEDDQVEALPVDVGAQAEVPRHLRRGGIAEDPVVPDEDGRLLAGDVEPLQDLVRVGVEVEVVEAQGDEVALQQVAHLEGAPRAPLGDQAQDAVPGALVPGAAREQAPEHQLPHVRRGRQERAQAGAVEDDRLGGLRGHALGHRRLAREGRDVADEGPGVGLRDPDLLAGLVVDEVDAAALDDEEGRVALALRVEDLARGERSALPLGGEHGHLVLGQARVEHLVGEIREALGLDPGRRHAPTLAERESPSPGRDGPPGAAGSTLDG